MSTRNIAEYTSSASKLDGVPAQRSSGLSTLGWAFLLIVPILLMVVFNKLIGFVLMSAGLWGPLLVIYWLMQIKEDEY